MKGGIFTPFSRFWPFLAIFGGHFGGHFGPPLGPPQNPSKPPFVGPPRKRGFEHVLQKSEFSAETPMKRCYTKHPPKPRFKGGPRNGGLGGFWAPPKMGVILGVKNDPKNRHFWGYPGSSGPSANDLVLEGHFGALYI